MGTRINNVATSCAPEGDCSRLNNEELQCTKPWHHHAHMHMTYGVLVTYYAGISRILCCTYYAGISRIQVAAVNTIIGMANQQELERAGIVRTSIAVLLPPAINFDMTFDP